MKKFGLFAVTLLSVLTLSACGPNEYKENMKNGEAKLEDKSYEEAIQYFEKAKKIEPKKVEPQQKILSAKDSYFNSLFTLGNTAFEKQEYAEAAELLEKAYELNPTKEETLLDVKTQAEDLNKKQKELDKYMKWLNETTQLNFSILKEWRSASDNVSIGAIKVKDFNEKAKSMLKTSDKLVISSEDQLIELSGELALTHTGYMAKLQENHDQLREAVLETQDPKATPSDVLSMGKNIENIREMQTLHVQSLKSYAQSTGLKFSEK